MLEILTSVTSASWWFSTVAIALIVNVTASYVFHRLKSAQELEIERTGVSAVTRTQRYPKIAALSTVHTLLTGAFWFGLMLTPPAIPKDPPDPEFVTLTIAVVQAVAMGFFVAWAASISYGTAVTQLVVFVTLFIISLRGPDDLLRDPSMFSLKNHYIMASAIACIVSPIITAIYSYIEAGPKNS